MMPTRIGLGPGSAALASITKARNMRQTSVAKSRLRWDMRFSGKGLE